MRVTRESLSRRLMSDSNWIKAYVGHCVKNHLSRKVFQEKILSVITDAANAQLNIVELEIQLASLAEAYLDSENDIASVIDCISKKIVHEAKSEDLIELDSLYLPLSCVLFARFFSIVSAEIGYISF